MLPYTVTDTATVYPMSCVGCGRTDGPFVDTHKRLHMGVHPGEQRTFNVYWCRRCVGFAAEALGMFDESRSLEERLRRAEEENVALTEVLGRSDAMIAEAVARERARRQLVAIPGGAS